MGRDSHIVFSLIGYIFPTIVLVLMCYTIIQIYKTAKNWFAFMLMLCTALWTVTTFLIIVTLANEEPVFTNGVIIGYEPSVKTQYVICGAYLAITTV